MSKPTPGKTYVVQKGDTLSGVSQAAYGDGRSWRKIWKANQQTLRSAKNPTFVAPNGKSGADLIFPGEILFIPGPAEPFKPETASGLEPEYIPGKGVDEATLIINGTEVAIQTLSVRRVLNEIADTWTATLAWEGEERKLHRLLKPFNYQVAEVYLGGVLVVRGFLYNVSRTVSAGGYVCSLEGFSKTADLVDSVVQPPYEVKKVTLKQRLEDLLEPYDIDLMFDIDDTEVFPVVKASDGATIFSHVAELASHRAAILTSVPSGSLRVTRAKSEGKSVGTLEEGVPPLLELSASYNGRDRFQVYTGKAEIQRKKGARKKKGAPTHAFASAKDPGVSRPRHATFSRPFATPGNIQQLANWERSKALAEAVSIKAKVAGWYIPGSDDVLWEENTLVSLVSRSLFLDTVFTGAEMSPTDPFAFSQQLLVKSADLRLGADGCSTELELVHAKSYSGEDLGGLL